MSDSTDVREMLETVTAGFRPDPNALTKALTRARHIRTRRRAATFAVAAVTTLVSLALLILAFSRVNGTAPPPRQVAGTPVELESHVVGQLFQRGQGFDVIAGPELTWSWGLDDTGRGTLVATDQLTETVARRVAAPEPVWESGGGGLVLRGNTLWVGGSGDGALASPGAILEAIDVTTGEALSEFSLPGAAVTGVAFGSDGSLWVTAEGAQPPVANSRDMLMNVDDQTGELLARFDILGQARRIAVAGDQVFVETRHFDDQGTILGSTLLSVNTSSGSASAIQDSFLLIGYEPQGNLVWGIAPDQQDVLVLEGIDASGHDIQETLRPPQGSSFRAGVAALVGSNVWVGVDDSDGRNEAGVAEFDLTTGSLLDSGEIARGDSLNALGGSATEVWGLSFEGVLLRAE